MRAPTPKEYQEQAAFVELVKRMISPHWRFTHIPLGEYRDVRTAMKLLRMGVMPGWPDFIFVGPQASSFFLELKRKRSGRIRSEQQAMMEFFLANGFAYLLTDDIEDAVGTLRDLGIIRSVEVQ